MVAHPEPFPRIAQDHAPRPRLDLEEGERAVDSLFELAQEVLFVEEKLAENVLLRFRRGSARLVYCLAHTFRFLRRHRGRLGHPYSTYPKGALARDGRKYSHRNRSWAYGACAAVLGMRKY